MSDPNTDPRRGRVRGMDFRDFILVAILVAVVVLIVLAFAA
jgi:hypothetical protein